MLASITRLLDRAQAEKPPLAQVADRVATYFTGLLFVFVALVAAYWWQHDATRMFAAVLSVLVVSCPCALSLAAPAALASASAYLIKRGVLVTRGHALETLAKVNRVVLDKTGTLTVGKPRLVQTHVVASVDAEDCLCIAASLEQISEHPIAHAFKLASQQMVLHPVSQAKNQVGMGVSGIIHGKTYRLGNPAFHGDTLPQHLSVPANIPAGASVIWLSDSQDMLAAFVLSDPLREGAQALQQMLTGNGIASTILSGDAQPAVAHVAQQLGVADWHADMSPERKLHVIKQYQQKRETVLMVGDGINDAPVMAGADVSIAMSGGTQLARLASDVVLLGEDIGAINRTLGVARYTMQIVRQNFLWALCYNLIALPFAAMGVLSPWMAAIGMSVSSLIVVLNALRIQKFNVNADENDY